jgi:hypothetical protein
VAKIPLLRELGPLGLKLLLVQVLIEIPFLILEASLLAGALAAGAAGANLWLSVALVIGLYALIEAGLWLVARMRGRPYQLLHAERALLALLWQQLRQRLRPA